LTTDIPAGYTFGHGVCVCVCMCVCVRVCVIEPVRMCVTPVLYLDASTSARCMSPIFVRRVESCQKSEPTNRGDPRFQSTVRLLVDTDTSLCGLCCYC